MKHANPKYNHISDSKNDIKPTEPVIIIRAGHPFAGDLAKHAAHLNMVWGGDPKLSEAYMTTAKEMDVWPTKKNEGYDPGAG